VKRKAPILILVLLVAAGGGYGYWWSQNHEQTVDDDSLTLYGNVDIREVHLAVNGSEHIGKMFVDEGDKVKKGQLLAQLHTDILDAELKRAQADLVAAKAEAHVAKLSYHRIRDLAANKAASQDDADVAEAKSRVSVAKVDSANAALAAIKQKLKDTKLYAPVDGIIRERIVEPGDFVTPQTPVFTLALTNPVWVRTYLPESWLGKVKPGTMAEIRTDSYPDKVYKGWVGTISPTAEFTPKSVETPELRTRLVYQARVFACNPDAELRLGMPATVTLRTDVAAASSTAQTQNCSAGTEPEK
jgi:HlyD family secretion protein